MKTLLSFLFVLLTVSFSFAKDSIYDGWWFDPNHPGTGVSIEADSSYLDIAIFSFSEEKYNGETYPFWYSSILSYDPSAEAFAGDIYFFTNGRSDTDYAINVKKEIVGAVGLGFVDENEAYIVYSVDNRLYGPVRIVKFMPTIVGAAPNSTLTGWWWDPDYPGMGLFLEVRGNRYFAAWYMYYSLEGVNYLQDLAAKPGWITISGAYNGSFESKETLMWINGSPFASDDYYAPKSSGAQDLQQFIYSDGILISNYFSSDNVKYTLNLQRFIY